MQRIFLLSRILKIIFSLYFIWLPVSFFLTWYFISFPPLLPSVVQYGFNSSQSPHSMLAITNIPVWPANILPPDSQTALAHLPIIWKTTACFVGIIGLALSMWFTFFIILLFNRYSQKQIFDWVSVKLIHKLGILFFGIQIYNFFARVLCTYIYTIPSNPIFAISFGTNEITALTIGCFLLVAYRIMYEGHKMNGQQLKAS